MLSSGPRGRRYPSTPCRRVPRKGHCCGEPAAFAAVSLPCSGRRITQSDQLGAAARRRSPTIRSLGGIDSFGGPAISGVAASSGPPKLFQRCPVPRPAARAPPAHGPFAGDAEVPPPFDARGDGAPGPGST
jgi:hypothetical protein